MKNIFILIILMSPLSTLAQNCFIGNNDSTGFDNSADPFWANIIAGVKINLQTNDTLLSLNLLGRNTGAQVQMAIYDDISGVPGNLLATSNVDIVGTGIISLPVSPTPLLAGDYWVMAIYDVDSGHTYNTTSDFGNVAYYDTLIFGDNIPVNASNFISFFDYNATYFMEVSCRTVGIMDINFEDKIKIFPNPSTDYIFISGLINETTCRIVDISGQYINEFQITKDLTKINVTHLNKGFYFLSIIDDYPYRMKFIKN